MMMFERLVCVLSKLCEVSLHTVNITDLALLGKIPIGPQIDFKPQKGLKINLDIRRSQAKHLITATIADVTDEAQITLSFLTLTSSNMKSPKPVSIL